MSDRHGIKQRDMERRKNRQAKAQLREGDKDWDTSCSNCEGKPTVHPTELCGPCCFGEAETINGNW